MEDEIKWNIFCAECGVKIGISTGTDNYEALSMFCKKYQGHSRHKLEALPISEGVSEENKLSEPHLRGNPGRGK